MEPISIRVDRKLSDYVEAYSATTNPLVRLALGLAFIAIGAWFVAEASRTVDVVLGVFGGVELAAGLMTLYVIPYYVWRFPRKMYAAHKAHAFQDYELTDEGLGISTNFGDSYTKWVGFARVLETTHLWLLYFDSSLFYILPKRCVPLERLPDAKELLMNRVCSARTEVARPG